MEIRITYRSEVYLKGENLAEIKEKWENLNLDPISKDSTEGFGFVEIVSVEDADTYKDLESEFENAFQKVDTFESYGLNKEQEQIALTLYKENKLFYGNYTLEEVDADILADWAENCDDAEQQVFYEGVLENGAPLYQLIDHVGEFRQPIGEIVFYED